MKKPTYRRTVGNVLAVPVGHGVTCFALTLPEADFAFFGPEAVDDVMSVRLFEHPVLFRVAVHKSAWNGGRWPKRAKLALPAELQQPAPTFIQDALDPGRFGLYVGGEIRPASRSECEGLERMAVWEPEQVEDRLRDHLAGVPNVWVEQLRLR